MPYEMIHSKNGNITWGICVRWSGCVTSKNLLEVQQKAHAHPDWDSIRYVIHDFGECEHFASYQDDIAILAALDWAAGKSNHHSVKIAFVSANEKLVEAACAYATIGLSLFPLRCFSSLDEAGAWVK